ncbi:MAG: type IV pilus biogenesis/stability protein PilW [Sphingomonas sp.]
MKMLSLLAVAGLSFTSATAIAQSVESGYPRGSLAVAAIEQGDWTRAEALLNGSQVDREDPAYLLNLGQVYMRTGRTAEALAAWRQARDSSRHAEVETLNGRLASTRDLAREALARYATAQLGTR